MKASLMSVSAVALIGLCAVALVANGQSEKSAAALKPTLIINLTSGQEDLHAVMMGLHFAEHGLADGRQVAVFFNVKAPPLAKKDLPDSVRFQELTPVRTAIADLLQQGAKMVVCPMCAEITGVEAEDLAPGIEMIADRGQIFDHMHANSVVFTY
jgi:predicted peroxiredoxin